MTCPGAVHRRIRKSRQRLGRKWLGTTTSATEAAGCVLWEEHGNVEYHAKTEQPLCNVRGTCLCKGSDARWDWGLGREGANLSALGALDGDRGSAGATVYCKKRDHARKRSERNTHPARQQHPLLCPPTHSLTHGSRGSPSDCRNDLSYGSIAKRKLATGSFGETPYQPS